MPDRYDSIGGWSQMGTITPILFQWVKFPNATVDYNDTFRINFSIPSLPKLKSWAWIRPTFIMSGSGGTTNNILVQPATKIYPKPQSMILSFPYPKEFMDRHSFINRIFEVQKIIRLPKYTGITTDPLWSMSLEELIG